MVPMSYIKEEQTSSDESRIKQRSSVRRHRASVACTLCRDRRIRCVVPAGKKACMQCERSSNPCVIKDDDERRRPISRAYVYSLVERVALLEQMLEEQGLKVPPATYPPETRHGSRRNKNNSSADSASSFSSTPQETSYSDDHATSSPYHAVEKDHDGLTDTKSRKRSSIVMNAKDFDGRDSKRTRNDSLITLADVKVEPPVDFPFDANITHYEEAFNFHSVTTTTTSSQPPFWPMAYDHTGGLTALVAPLQNKPADYAAFSAWSNDAFGYGEHSSYTTNTQHGEESDLHHYDMKSPVGGVATNLDFMPLGASR